MGSLKLGPSQVRALKMSLPQVRAQEDDLDHLCVPQTSVLKVKTLDLLQRCLPITRANQFEGLRFRWLGQQHLFIQVKPPVILEQL
jgi:hypothetical protein